MTRFFIFFLFSALAAGLWLCPARGMAQYKAVYRPEEIAFPGITNFRARGIQESAVPGGELLLCGSMIALDSSGEFTQPWFLFRSDYNGTPVSFDFYEDSAAFIFSGAAAYATAEGGGNIYAATGSNNYQMISSVRSDGTPRWTTALRHHEFYDIIYENDTSIVALGQDESLLGVHDFSIVRLDSGGNFRRATMIGLAGFDQPEKLIPVPGGYFTAGWANDGGTFSAMVAKLNLNLELEWGYTYLGPADDHIVTGAVSCPDGFALSGVVQTAGKDSLFLLKISNTGVPVFYRNYTLDTLNLGVMAMAVDPATGNFFLAGGYGIPGQQQPFVLKTDPLGVPVWARAYGEGVSHEGFTDIICLSGRSAFAACGDFQYFDSAAYQYRIFMVTASLDSGVIPCDTSLFFQSNLHTVTVDSQLIESPFAVSYPYGFNHFVSKMETEAICSFPVVREEPAAEWNALMFENPAGEELHISWVRPGAVQLRVTDVNGNVAIESRVSGKRELSLSLHTIRQGMYIVELLYPDGTAVRRKMLKW